LGDLARRIQQMSKTTRPVSIELVTFKRVRSVRDIRTSCWQTSDPRRLGTVQLRDVRFRSLVLRLGL
jgi:hypothetical protein